MKKITFLLVLVLITANLFADGFSVDAYKDYLNKTQDMTVEQFYQMYPPGTYYKEVNIPNNVEFFDEVKKTYNLTNDEILLLEKHGFVISERLSQDNIWDVLRNVYKNDLPVFISSDMILHALHMSYDAILRTTEQRIIYSMLDEALLEMHNELSELKKIQAPNYLTENINDVDIYITVARKLLTDENIKSLFNNDDEVIKILEMIKGEKPINYALFSSTPKNIDFSQYTPRGHYTRTEELTKYFKTMMWLGRTQFYLTKPKSDDMFQQSDADIQRQIIDAALISELINKSKAKKNLESIDNLIKIFVGESDNVKVEHILDLMKELSINDPAEFQNMNTVEKFQELLKTKEYAGQKILSQILMSNPGSPDQIEPSSSFMVMGQRFILDSYITGNVVYDKIMYKGEKVLRMQPSALDVLFALGNNASADLLKPEFEKFPYMSNLASLRYLVDGYESEYWKQSFYSSWLNSIRMLNVPEKAELGKYPEFMKTAAWWQSRMNTQLASWAQLRHDNLLYAKQSYTGGVSCEFPTAYVEPEADLFAAVSELAGRAKSTFTDAISNMDVSDEDKYFINRIEEYFTKLEKSSKMLESIALAQLKGNVTKKQMEFLKQTYSTINGGCVTVPDGWYAEMFFESNESVQDPDYVVADVHTTPTDASGAPVGWVWHVGTGKINTMFVIAEDENGKPTLFTGATLSFHEVTSLNFERYTDEMWAKYFYLDMNNINGISRPTFTQLYLADNTGNNSFENPPILPTSVADEEPTNIDIDLKTYAHPNPFNESVVIGFRVPDGMIGERVTISIYDESGNMVTKLHESVINSGSYSIRWDGKNDKNIQMPNGVYLYRFDVGEKQFTGKIILQK